MMVGVELADSGKALGAVRSLLARGFIVVTGGTAGGTLTLSPPLTIEPALLSRFAETLSEVVGRSA